MNLSLDAAIRTLLLPVKPGVGEQYSSRAEEILVELGVTEDFADWVYLQSNAWTISGTPSREFKTFVERLLYSPSRVPQTYAIDLAGLGNEEEINAVLRAFSTRYFELHGRVMGEENVGHEEAKRILSHTHTIILLATGARMTASRIFALLLTDGIVLGKSWSTPRFILDRCGLGQDLSVNEVEVLYKEDADAEPELLGDLNLEASIQYVAEVCGRFGYSLDLARQLRTLFITDLHQPYLCMLHFQLTTLAKYNHRLTNAYEFRPRGVAVLWLSEQYNESGLTVGLSPFLNNAKSVDTLDAAWASSKKPSERHAARALTDLLSEMDDLSDPSRAAIGRYLRSLLQRHIRTAREANEAQAFILPEFTAETTRRLLEGVAIGNTGTRGVIEQRLCDCLALIEADDLSRWRTRGIGDSVFTTNTSQRKLGDIELKHLENPTIVATEAHGGRLTEKYVQDHLFTLRNVLPDRAAELEDRAPLADWTIDLQFFAHQNDMGMTENAVASDVSIKITYRRFADFAELPIDREFLELIERHFRTPLNAIHVHPSTRQAVLELLQ